MLEAVTAKAQVLEAVSQMEESASMDEILDAIEFRAGVDRALKQLDNGEGIPHEEVRKRLARWLD